MTVSKGYGAVERRVEDAPLITGRAHYADDLKLPNEVHAVFLRSWVPHARIAGIDTSATAEIPGVVGVFTAADLGLGTLPALVIPEAMARPVLASDRVRFLGEAVAVVVAETLPAAVDAAGLVDVEYESLDHVIDPERALEPDAPRLFEDHLNLAAGGENGEPDALDGAEVVVRSRFVNQRVAPAPLEPPAAVAAPDPATGGVTLWAPTQAPFAVRDAVAAALDLEPEQVRVIVPSVGGSFGARIPPYPEQVAVAGLAHRLGRPVRYSETRSEAMVAMVHGRGQVQDVELGATRDGTLTGIKVDVVADCGAYPGTGWLMPVLTGEMACGVYRIPRVAYRHRCVVTNTTPMGSYRGAGRPEATALLERAMDRLAQRLDLDPAELRRRNLIASDDFPHETATGQSYDSGAYAEALDRVLELADYAALRAEQAARRERGDVRQLGIGLSTYVELTGVAGETARCTVDADGRVTVLSATVAHGQGHETTWKQLVSATLGVPMADVRVIHSDTQKTAPSMGTMASRSVQIGGSAVQGAADDVLAKGSELAAHLLEASPDDVAVIAGEGLGVAGSPSAVLSWAELAEAAADPARCPADMDPGLDCESEFTTPDRTYPFGAHLAVVEVDVETGLTHLVRHVSVDDAGRIANPALAEGQIHGGIAQGAAQALFEQVVYDADGNNVTGSLASYAMPGATDLPSYETERTETPSPRNPLGAKGIGESGTIGSTPAVWNAVVDAVAHLGVDHIEMPATPERVWRAIQDADGGPRT